MVHAVHCPTSLQVEIYQDGSDIKKNQVIGLVSVHHLVYLTE